MKKFKFAHCSARGEELASARIARAEQSPLITPIPCLKWENMLNSTNTDDLSYHERVALEKHLEECKVCASIRRHDRILDGMIRQLPFRDLSPSERHLPLPPRLERLWEFDKMQKNLTLEMGNKISSREVLAEDSSQIQLPNTIDEQYSSQAEEPETRNTMHNSKVVIPKLVLRIVILTSFLALILLTLCTVFLGTTLLLGVFVVVVARIVIIVFSFIVIVVIQRVLFRLNKDSKKGGISSSLQRKKRRRTFRELVLL